MDEKHKFESIDPTTFDCLLQQYTDAVPQKLLGLDQQRYETIPRSLQEQAEPKSLSKVQVATLVDWKLSHGKFRPTLKGLIQQNAVNVVQETTAAGYKVFTGAGPSARESLNILTKLKGVGPATASLLLSVYDRATAPFFSDEMFRWCFFDDAKGKGWDREMKYNLKEYIELFAKVQELRDRFGREFEREVSAVEVEKVAYVLGKQDSVVAGGEGSRGKKRKGEEEGNEAKKVGKVGVVAEKASDVEGGSAKRAQVKGKEGAAASRPRRNRK